MIVLESSCRLRRATASEVRSFETHHGHVESELSQCVFNDFWCRIKLINVMLSFFFVQLKLNVWSTCGQFINKKWFHWARYLVNMCVILTNYRQGTALRSMKLPSKTGESSPQSIFPRGKITHRNGVTVGNDGGLFCQVQAYLKWCSCPKLIFFCWGHFFGWNPCKITNTETQQIIQIQWFLWYHLGPKRFNPTKRVSPIQLSVHPPFSTPRTQVILLEDNDGNVRYVLHPGKLTFWKSPLFEKEKHLNQTFTFGLHVYFQRCISIS